MPSGTPLRCKAQGGWGGSAHWPDPTAQSAAAARENAWSTARARRGVPGAPAPGFAASRGVRHRHAIHAAPTTATLRVALAGRQTLPRRASGTDVPSALLSRVCHPRECSLRFDRHARHVRETGPSAVHCDRAVAMDPTLPRGPKGPVRTGRVSPPSGSDATHPIRPAIGTIALHRTAQQPCARDDVPMTSSDVAPRSQHPATLFPVQWDALSMPQRSGMNASH